jgi:guanylate kinase
MAHWLNPKMTTVFIISAPSGSGKSTLVSEIRRSVSGLDFSISYTTRKPRGSEKDGREYHFVLREQFEAMRARGEFLEWAEVFGNYYGTASCYVEDAKKAGHDVLLDIDVQGAAQIKQKLPDAVCIFVLPPSREELERRLKRRSEAEGFVNPAVLEKRLTTARREIEKYPEYDYILINDRLEESIDLLKAIVLSERAQRSGIPLSDQQISIRKTAERCLLSHERERVQQVLATFAMSSAPGTK